MSDKLTPKTDTEGNIYYKALDEMMIVNCLGTADGCESVADVMEKINQLIHFGIDVDRYFKENPYTKRAMSDHPITTKTFVKMGRMFDQIRYVPESEMAKLEEALRRLRATVGKRMMADDPHCETRLALRDAIGAAGGLEGCGGCA